MKSFLTGFAFGIGIGMLFAPRRGEELRNTITEKAGNWADSARETFEKGQQKVRDMVSSTKGEQREASGSERGSSWYPATGSESGR